MASIDPRTPVIVGVAQVSQRPTDISEAVEPVALMTLAASGALADSGSTGDLAGRLDRIAVLRGAWGYTDPAQIVADNVGASAATTILTGHGGNTPLALLSEFCAGIHRGRFDGGIITGAETIWSRKQARNEGIDLPTTTQPEGTEPDETYGSLDEMSGELELAQGVAMPIHYYPMFESRIRHERGESLDEHRHRIAGLWSRMNDVAVGNPNAWDRAPMTTEAIRDVGPGNRMVAFPYTKAMCSNWFLDQGAAIVVVAAEVADAAGVPRDRWVFPQALTTAHDALLASHRPSFADSPSMRIAGNRALEMAGVQPDDLAHIDLYSCFPSAVQLAADAMGIDQERQLTLTGGLCFAGGPLNNYVTHSLAAATDTLRSDPGSLGLVTANGGMLTKHAFGVFSTTPPTERGLDGVRIERCQEAVDADGPLVDAVGDHEGRCEIEAATVLHTHAGRERAVAAVRTPDGKRAWAQSADADVMAAFETEECCGRAAHRTAAGVLTLT